MEHSQIILWIIFVVVSVAMLFFDLFMHRNAHEIKIKEALIWSVIWVVLALLFNLGIYYFSGKEKALNFFTGYLVERALSMDNLFVFLMIFSYFKVPKAYQHSVLFWGILGAFTIRGFFILAGVAVIEKFHWMIYVFGLMLIYSGIKMITEKDKNFEPEKNPILKLFRKTMPVTEHYEGGKFFVRRDNRVWATPLFVALVFIEISDIIFAVDSIPAILAITRDPFIVYSSNVFAILGLRALYFALAAIMGLFCYLNYGLSFILVLIGAKMLLHNVLPIPVGYTLIAVMLVLVISVVASILKPKTNSIEEQHVID